MRRCRRQCDSGRADRPCRPDHRPDRVDRKLRWAEELGATDTIDASTDDAVTRIRELTNGRGVAFAFDAVGIPTTLGQAIDVLDYRGTAVMIGFPSPDDRLELQLQPCFFAGANLRVSLGGDGIPALDLPLLAEWYRTGVLDLDRLVTRHVGQADVDSAFAAMEAGKTLRSVIEFRSPNRTTSPAGSPNRILA